MQGCTSGEPAPSNIVIIILYIPASVPNGKKEHQSLLTTRGTMPGDWLSCLVCQCRSHYWHSIPGGYWMQTPSAVCSWHCSHTVCGLHLWGTSWHCWSMSDPEGHRMVEMESVVYSCPWNWLRLTDAICIEPKHIIASRSHALMHIYTCLVMCTSYYSTVTPLHVLHTIAL